MKISHVLKLLASVLMLSFSATAFADTLSDTKSRGHVRCGVSQGLPGFSNPDASGNWEGIDVESTIVQCEPSSPVNSPTVCRGGVAGGP